MSHGKKILYAIMAGIPVAFILFILAMVNIVFLLLGIVVLLIAAVVLKRCKPELFIREKQEIIQKDNSTNKDRAPGKVQVYMVLAGSEDFGARRIAVNKTSYSIGRAVDNDYVIDGGKISRHHLTIEYNAVENICYAIDTGSANGTYINSIRMAEGQRYRLEQGDRLMIDDRSFVVEYAHY